MSNLNQFSNFTYKFIYAGFSGTLSCASAAQRGSLTARPSLQRWRHSYAPWRHAEPPPFHSKLDQPRRYRPVPHLCRLRGHRNINVSLEVISIFILTMKGHRKWGATETCKRIRIMYKKYFFNWLLIFTDK